MRTSLTPYNSPSSRTPWPVLATILLIVVALIAWAVLTTVSSAAPARTVATCDVFLLTQDHVTTPGVYRRLIVVAADEAEARQIAYTYALAKEDASADAWLYAEGSVATDLSAEITDPELILSTTEAG